MSSHFVRISVPPIAAPAGATPELLVLQRSVISAFQNLVQQINNQVDVGEADLDMNGHRISNLGDAAAQRDAVNVTYLRRFIDELGLGKGISTVINNGTGGTGTITISSLTLTANTAISLAAPTTDAILVVVITQDGTGDWTITWNNPPFATDTLTDLDYRANAVTVYVFAGVGGLWKEICIPFLRN